MGNELSMCVEPENEAAERRFWRKESHGNVNFNNFSNVNDTDNNANAGKFKVDNESRYGLLKNTHSLPQLILIV